MSGNPSIWSNYIQRRRSDNLPPDEKFARFRARYFLAHNIETLTIADMSDGTAHAYFAALRVTLAYTALESLEIAIGCRHQTKIIDSEIANLIRLKHQKLIDVTDKTLKGDAKKEYRLSLQKFTGDDSHDLTPFVYGVRNLMAHGQFTAARFGLTAAPNRRKLIHSLADLTLRTADDRFSIYVTKMRNRT